MRGLGRAVVVILVGILALITGIGAASAQAASPPEQPSPLIATTRMTNASGEFALQPEQLTSGRLATAANTFVSASTSDTNTGTVNNGNQNTSDSNLQPSPPSGTMTFAAWIALAAFIIGVVGLVAAAVVLRRINE